MKIFEETMKRLRFILLFFLFIIVCNIPAIAKSYKVTIIFSRTAVPANVIFYNSIKRELSKFDFPVQISREYIDAIYLNKYQELSVAREICKRLHRTKPDLIITSRDEAFYDMMSTGDPIMSQTPVLFFGIKFPSKFIDFPNVCGYYTTPGYYELIQRAAKMFSNRKCFFVLRDESFLAKKADVYFRSDINRFLKTHQGYSVEYFNTDKQMFSQSLSLLSNSSRSGNFIVFSPMWDLSCTMISKSSQAPVFSAGTDAISKGALGAYDINPREVGQLISHTIIKLLKGTSAKAIGIKSLHPSFTFDWKQLMYFRYDTDLLQDDDFIMNRTFIEKYGIYIYSGSVLILFILIIIIIVLAKRARRQKKEKIVADNQLNMQNSLLQQRDEYDNIFQSLHECIETFDMNLKIGAINFSFLNMLHIPDEENTPRAFEGQPAGTLYKLVQNGKDILEPMIIKALETGKHVVIPPNTFIKPNNYDEYILISGEVALIVRNDVISGAVLTCHNMSKEEIQRKLLNMAAENVSIIYWLFDMRSREFVLSEKYFNEFESGEITGNLRYIPLDKILNRIHPDDKDKCSHIIENFIEGKLSSVLIDLRMKYYQKEGEDKYTWWKIRVEEQNYSHINPYLILGVAQDIQIFKDNEKALIEARNKAQKADKLKSAFLANMSHEIRTPLNAIVGFANILIGPEKYSPEDTKDFISIINKNCALLLSLINDVLDLSRTESGTMDFKIMKYNLTTIMKDIRASQSLNMPSTVDLILKLPDKEKYMNTDSIRLQQVINNLINNAVKFTTNGSITFGYEDHSDGYITFFVEDTGKGISKESCKHIFERFFKEDNFVQGAGLGLSICETIVQKLGGTISVTSELNKGSRFVVVLPDNIKDNIIQ